MISRMAGDQIIKVYVGTDPHMQRAEIALENSILANTKSQVEIIWMDYSRGGLWADWNIGREHGQPYSKEGWATDFSCYRFAIPEANGFEGRAIYLDVDMILLKDIKELLALPMLRPILIPPQGFDVILFDCQAFKDVSWWPKISEMRPSGWTIPHYAKLLFEHDMVAPLSPDWNCLDGANFHPEFTGLLHFTNMRTQPWKPYPEQFEYPSHPRQDMVALWQKNYEDGLKRKQS